MRAIATTLFLALVTQGAVAPAQRFSSERAWDHLVAQVEFGPRVPGTAAHGKCLAWLEERLRSVTSRVSKDPFDGTLEGERVRLTNLFADIGPPGPRPILLAAHWDTRPWADQDPIQSNRSTPIAGANDGASGVAVLLELARVLRPQVPVKLAFFDGEDLGRELNTFFQGSRRYAKSLKAPFPRWGILLDMVGDRDLQIPREAFSAEAAPQLLDRIVASAKRVGASAAFPDRPGARVYDDHWPLIEAGVQMVDLIDFDYTAWHTLADTPDACDARSLEKVGRTLVDLVESERH